MVSEEMKETTCADCGVLLGEEEYYNCDGEPICEHCMEDYYICDDCGDTVPVVNINVVNDGDRCVCDYCLREYYYTCDDCGDSYDQWGVHIDDNGTIICNSCFDMRYIRCNRCDTIINIDHACWHHDDGAFCSYCYDERQEERGHINPYNYRPYDFTMYGDDGRTSLFYGVELEIDGSDDLSICGDLGEVEEIYLKDDGSLSCGFEIVTHPATLDYHLYELPWRDICSIARNGGYKSHDTSTCGLHIHASRAGFGHTTMEQDLTIAKLMLLFDRFWDDKIVPFSRRDYHNLDRWAKKPNSSITDKDTAGVAVQKVQDYKYDRYRAINLTNQHTVEFRIFRGTLKYTTILASIQWIDTLIHFCKNTPLKDFARVTWEEIFADTEHVELREYMEKRNLIKKGGM